MAEVTGVRRVMVRDMKGLLSCAELVFFFFQAEDGIRDYKVTGVQTCALPICRAVLPQSFENSAKGVPQGNFSIGSKIKSFLKPPHILANFMLISYLKTVLRCRHRFSYNELDRKSVV